ncbi:hypothetical protein [Exiguobacterium aurantiacum]|uniref:hypothetical protein n=1 Tax=Exiguobacterium aurantiacum TaxID=33987 RepID=UPI00135A2BDD|nr:hypothetical protein [Exiguobacterium aurantiacum]
MNEITMLNKYASSVGLWFAMWFLAYTTVEHVGWSLIIATVGYVIWRNVIAKSSKKATRTFDRKLRGIRLRQEQELYEEEKRRWNESGRLRQQNGDPKK